MNHYLLRRAIAWANSCLFLFSFSLLGQSDTSITYWDNGQNKIVTIHKKKSFYDRQSDTTIAYLKRKKTLYYDPSGKQVAEKKFREIEFNRTFERIQQRMSVAEDNFKLKKNALLENSEPSNLNFTVQDSSGIQFSIELALKDTINNLTFIEGDSLINGNPYEVLIYNSENQLFGAMRMVGYELYLLQFEDCSEELIIDFKQFFFWSDELSKSVFKFSGKAAGSLSTGLNEVSKVAAGVRNQLIYCLFHLFAH